MKNIVTALMQFVILVVALIIVTFAIPKIAGNDDRYDKYIAETQSRPSLWEAPLALSKTVKRLRILILITA